MAIPDSPTVRVEGGAVHCSGAWTVHLVAGLDRALRRLAWPEHVAVVIDASGVAAMDTAGAWLLRRAARDLERGGRPVTLTLRPEHEALLALVTSSGEVAPRRARERARFLSELGRSAWSSALAIGGVLTLVGELAGRVARARAGPLRVRARQAVLHVQSAGFEALPTTALLSFFVGVVLASQGATLLRPFGAGILIADLVGLAMLRELSPLVTAIVVAGRSGSAYAAQIGAMKMAGEIESLRAGGVSPVDALVVPRIAALALVVPLLTVAADVLGLAGATLVARAELGMHAPEFLGRVAREVHASSYLLGVAKAPVFGVIVAAVGCHQGLRASDDAGSVGRRTTGAVVQSMFLVVLADGLVLVVSRQLGI
ncbi:protein of unknown function DUF140 [Anaeromyxobacter sp. K]|uniref:ABC transporter permease n=1 Tax=Anaeromyxobacter sp. (strain K) TaxID=447217 RepID=UPI00015F8707|nr:ABC transporter permease [Anaeromyxobacter sp. K]ACG71620.1 protein of unknown function DUF140 [Anaeromyxobacter sp. K]